LQSHTGTVGVLATRGTLASTLFADTSRNHAHSIKIVVQEGTGLVSLIEAGKTDAAATRELLINYLRPMLKANMDHLVLGCTHYPYLIPVLKELLPDHIKIIDCGEAVARQTLKVLKDHQLLNTSGSPGRHQFYTNSDPEVLRYFIQDSGKEATVEYLEF
jgi:glutamate racemase